MNALELATLLGDSNDPDVRKAATMLRQQHAEIESLKKTLSMLISRRGKSVINGYQLKEIIVDELKEQE